MKLAIACVCGGLLALSACSKTTGQPGLDSPAAYQPDYRQGMYAYTDHCSECHDTGRNGAPLLDDSPQWQARGRAFPTLLRDHGREGWLSAAPGRVSHVQLNERSVADALGYMLRDGS